MIEITWAAGIGFIAVMGILAPGFYWLGRLSNQVDTNTNNIKSILAQIRTIHEYVKNGGH